MKRWTMFLTVLLGGCLAGCPMIEDAVCEGVLLEEATAAELARAALDLGLEDLGGLFGDDD